MLKLGRRSTTMKIILIVIILIIATGCDNIPLEKCGPDGCTRNGFLIDENGEYIE